MNLKYDLDLCKFGSLDIDNVNDTVLAEVN